MELRGEVGSTFGSTLGSTFGSTLGWRLVSLLGPAMALRLVVIASVWVGVGVFKSVRKDGEGDVELHG